MKSGNRRCTLKRKFIPLFAAFMIILVFLLKTTDNLWAQMSPPLPSMTSAGPAAGTEGTIPPLPRPRGRGGERVIPPIIGNTVQPPGLTQPPQPQPQVNLPPSTESPSPQPVPAPKPMAQQPPATPSDRTV